MFDWTDGGANIGVLYALYKAWCKKTGNDKVNLSLETDGSGGLEKWHRGEYDKWLIEWDAIQDGCEKLAKALEGTCYTCIP